MPRKLRCWRIELSKEALVQRRLVQLALLAYSLIRHFWLRYARRDMYGAYSATLWYQRASMSVSGWVRSAVVDRLNSRLLAITATPAAAQSFRLAYLRSAETNRWLHEFGAYGREHRMRLRYPREPDTETRQGDLLILKPHRGANEKGVLLLKYNDAFRRFVSIYDIDRVASCYRIVLEPSTWGYCDPSILLFLDLPTDIIIQAQSFPDYEFIRSVGRNFVPIRLGAGDWIDPDMFRPSPERDRLYDVVMIASWQGSKRHNLLFAALSQCGSAIGRVALIGYPSGGRTRDDILQQARDHGVEKKITVFENIPRTQVSEVIGQSRIGVMLTVREGANKGIYECMFSNIPVLISDRNIGVNRDHINQFTGVAARDDGLAAALTTMLAEVTKYRPREWALQFTGYRNSTRVLGACIRARALLQGEEWTADIYSKKNEPNGFFASESERLSADEGFAHLGGFLR